MKELFVLVLLTVNAWIYEGDKAPIVHVETKEIGIFNTWDACNEALGKHQGRALMNGGQSIQCLRGPAPSLQRRYQQ